MKQYLTKTNLKRVAIAAGAIAVVVFLEAFPAGRAIVFAVQNPGVVNNVAAQQQAAVKKLQFVINSPKAQ